MSAITPGIDQGGGGVGGEVTVHANLTGLSADDHTQYPLLNGRALGQSIIGGTASGEDLSLESTSNGSKGSIIAKDNLLASKQIIGNGTNGLLDLRGAQGGSVGGDVSISGGFGLTTSGKINITGGSTNSTGSNVSIQGGAGPTGQSGAVILQGGTSGDDNGLGGDILLLAGQGGVVTGKGGDITISAGDSEGSGQAPGAVNIKGGERIGFSERGDLVLQDTGGRVGIGVPSPSVELDINGEMNATKLAAGSLNVFAMNAVPASATAAGETGEIRFTSDHIYVCVATNTWERVAIATWV